MGRCHPCSLEALYQATRGRQRRPESSHAGFAALEERLKRSERPEVRPERIDALDQLPP